VIGIAIAAGGIPDTTLYRCLRSIGDSGIETDYMVASDRHKEEPFSRAACRNRAMKKLIPHCDKIVCIDVDVLIPPGLVDAADKYIAPLKAFWAKCYHLKKFTGEYHWDKWKVGRPYGPGAFIGMTTEDWIRVGGWDERLVGWGHEDTVLRRMRQKCGISTHCTTFWPLVHVDHAPYSKRSGSRARHNRWIGMHHPPPRNFLLTDPEPAQQEHGDSK